jgi:hypothetical protein
MNICFTCSITGGREFEPVYQAIVCALTEDQHGVPTAHLAGSDAPAREAVLALYQEKRTVSKMISGNRILTYW